MRCWFLFLTNQLSACCQCVHADVCTHKNKSWNYLLLLLLKPWCFDTRTEVTGLYLNIYMYRTPRCVILREAPSIKNPSLDLQTVQKHFKWTGYGWLHAWKEVTCYHHIFMHETHICPSGFGKSKSCPWSSHELHQLWCRNFYSLTKGH